MKCNGKVKLEFNDVPKVKIYLYIGEKTLKGKP